MGHIEEPGEATRRERGTLRTQIKHRAARLASALPQVRYERTILILSHMRSASSALSGVICSHPSVSGYGETHVVHDSRHAPGALAVNLARRGAFRIFAPCLFDKVLHNLLDLAPPPDFFTARAIFLVRQPEPAISSICSLARRTGMRGESDPEGAACYLADRMERLARLWDAFPPERRLGVLTEELLSKPDREVSRVGDWLGLDPPLANAMRRKAVSMSGGAGDPDAAGYPERIVARQGHAQALPPGTVDPAALSRCREAYDELLGRLVRARS